MTQRRNPAIGALVARLALSRPGGMVNSRRLLVALLGAGLILLPSTAHASPPTETKTITVRAPFTDPKPSQYDGFQCTGLPGAPSCGVHGVGTSTWSGGSFTADEHYKLTGTPTTDGKGNPRASAQLDTSSTCQYGVAVAPEATVATALDFNQKVRLRTLVLVDRAEPSIAPQIMRRVIEEYGRIGIVLDVTYQPITLSGTDAGQLMSQTRAQLASARVGGFDLVHVLTGADLTIDGKQYAGEAYCIGGIREAKYYMAMSISVTSYDESLRGNLFFGRVNKTYFRGGPAIVAAHEIGHVLGALHQHGNCAENAKSALDAGEATLCTVMDATLGFSKLRFGRVERAVIRGYAIRYGSH